METKLVHEDKVYTITKTQKTVKYTGCQCFKDCNCRDNYPYEHISFILHNKNYHKNQVTTFKTLEDALESRFRINESRIKYGKLPFDFA